ncbi:MAG: hypothetical protein IPF66_18580 [Holophagales bacterium]|nr:hypothetical protein [Holophagales bacterium]
MTKDETPARILVVDDSPSTLEVLRRNLVNGGLPSSAARAPPTRSPSSRSLPSTSSSPT